MEARGRICLITPGHLSTNPRLVKEADALSTAGYDVSVISTRFLEWADKHDASFRSRPWNSAARIPFGPLAPAAIRAKQVARQRMARAALAAGFARDIVREADWHHVAPDLTAATLEVKADLYIAHYPAALPAAAKAAARHGARYAFDAEDFHLGDLPDLPEHNTVRARLRAIEARYLPGAAFVTAAAPGIADAYVDAYAIARPTPILNVFPLSHAPETATSAGTAEPGPSLYWLSQTIGPGRGLETAVAAIATCPTRPHLYLRGRPTPGFIEHLKQCAGAPEAASRIHVLDIAAPHDMVRLAAAFDLGLVAETSETRNRALCLSNKLFTYLLAGVPPLISDTPGQRAFARSACLEELVYPIGDDAALAQRLDAILSSPSRLAGLRRACFDLGQTSYNWEIESQALLDIVARTVGMRAAARSHA